jgi:CubicO group peptidase (beta-lactamase class C family)
VDAFLAPLVEADRLSGVVLIGSRDSIRFARAYGLADRESGTPNSLATRFHIASLTKTFTSAAILRLADQGALALGDTLSRWSDEFGRGDEITVRHLLLHASGLRNPPYGESFERTIELPELVSAIAAQPLDFDPGTESRYSNAGYNVLAMIVEREGGSYEGFLGREVFEPLGMTATGHARDHRDVAAPYLPAPAPDVAWRVPDSDVTGYTFGSGSLVSSAEDLWRWGAAVADERIVGWKDLEWPYGWGRLSVADATGIEQTGATNGYMSSLLVLPDADVVVVTLHNMELGGWVPLAQGLAALALGEAPADPGVTAVPVAADVPEGELDRYVGEYRSAQDVTFHVRRDDGHLRMYFDTWPIGKFLEFTGEAAAVPLGDGGRLRFDLPATGPASAFTWSFGEGDGTVYERVEG